MILETTQQTEDTTPARSQLPGTSKTASSGDLMIELFDAVQNGAVRD